LLQAKADFAAICTKDNSQTILDAADRGLAVDLDRISVEHVLGLSAAIVNSPKIHISQAAKPWGA